MRRVKAAFREHRGVQNGAELDSLFKEGKASLEMLKRQTTIGNMFKDVQPYAILMSREAIEKRTS